MFWVVPEQELSVVTAVLVALCCDVSAGGHAHSSTYFKGPVVGPAQEVVVSSGHGGYGGHDGGHGGHVVDYVAHPKYEFGYEVTDHHTGDSHYQKESRDGDKVVGEYALKEPGGNVRTVKYVADKHGFHPVVHNSHDFCAGGRGSILTNMASILSFTTVMVTITLGQIMAMDTIN
uniref:Uncharacterized protein n=1 Tax=Timema cristinae TaxID=61476 RepID=A0A7R9D4C0_TIMCR|nr:unnamed protein product [Timema cristinae]